MLVHRSWTVRQSPHGLRAGEGALPSEPAAGRARGQLLEGRAILLGPGAPCRTPGEACPVSSRVGVCPSVL